MKSLPIFVVAFAATVVTTSAPRAAQSPSTIADYLNRTPTVIGSVTAADDHSVTLSTDSGSPMTFLVDSRSVVPAELPSGTQIRVEFHVLGADAFHAARITPLTGAEIRAREEMAQPHLRASSESVEGTPTSMSTTEAEGTAPAQTIETRPTSELPPRTAAANETSAPGSTVSPQTEPSASEPADQSKEESQLPRTASSLPLVGMVGAVALAASIGIGFLRRRHRG